MIPRAGAALQMHAVQHLNQKARTGLRTPIDCDRRSIQKLCSIAAHGPMNAKERSKRSARDRQRYPAWQHASISASLPSREAPSRFWRGSFRVLMSLARPRQRQPVARCLDPCFRLRRHQWPRARPLRWNCRAFARSVLSARVVCTQPSRRSE